MTAQLIDKQPGRQRLRMPFSARAWMEMQLLRHGVWGLAVGLMLVAAATLFGAAQMLDEKSPASNVPVRKGEVATPQPGQHTQPVTVPNIGTSAAATATPATDQAALTQLRQVLIPTSRATEQVRHLVKLTQPELAWQKAEFQQTEEVAALTTRLQITVPVLAEYRSTRSAVDRALLAIPNLSLDQVLLRRQQSSDAVLESRLKFSIWLSGPATPDVQPILGKRATP